MHGEIQIPPDGAAVIGQGGLDDYWPAPVGMGNQIDLNPLAVKPGEETKEQPVMATTAKETLELNLAAKKPDPFTKLDSVVSLTSAIKAGKYIEINLPANMAATVFYRDVLDPKKKHTLKDMQYYIKHGVFAHDTKKVLLYQPVKFEWGGSIMTWNSWYAYDMEVNDNEDIEQFIGRLTDCVYEGTTFNV